jgi:hypothetical protein
MGHWRPRIGLIGRVPLLALRNVGHWLGGPSSRGYPGAAAPQACGSPDAGAEAEEGEDEAVAEVGAHTEVEAAAEGRAGAGAEAVAVAEAGRAESHAGMRGPPGERPREVEAAFIPWCQPVYEG